MAEEKLKSFQDIARDLALKYHIPYEIAEAILIDWTKLLYDNMRAEFDMEKLLNG